MSDIREGNIDEPDRRTIIANDIVVDVITNEDGSVYVEFYGYGGQRLAFSDVVLDRFYGGLADNAHPSLRILAR